MATQDDSISSQFKNAAELLMEVESVTFVDDKCCASYAT
jgi:hypothetical protein